MAFEHTPGGASFHSVPSSSSTTAARYGPHHAIDRVRSRSISAALSRAMLSSTSNHISMPGQDSLARQDHSINVSDRSTIFHSKTAPSSDSPAYSSHSDPHSSPSPCAEEIHVVVLSSPCRKSSAGPPASISSPSSPSIEVSKAGPEDDVVGVGAQRAESRGRGARHKTSSCRHRSRGVRTPASSKDRRRRSAEVDRVDFAISQEQRAEAELQEPGKMPGPKPNNACVHRTPRARRRRYRHHRRR